jgi:RNA polymerase sigma factor (sigma-70 family)
LPLKLIAMQRWCEAVRASLQIVESAADTPSQAGFPAAAFEELALPLFDSLYNFARWIAQDVSEAEDLVQETYLKALRSFASFQPGTNFRAWMFRILKNTFLSSQSKLERRMTVAINLQADELESGRAGTPDAVFEMRSDFESVRRALDDLPSHSREVLILCDVEGMSYKEIAGVLAIPVGTVMSRLSRARSALRSSVRCSSGFHASSMIPAEFETTK